METANKEKTKLQELREKLGQEMTRAIVEAIKDGEEHEIIPLGGVCIGGVYLTSKYNSGSYGFVLDINAPEIDQLFNPRKEYLEKRAEELRSELERIENELKI